MSSFNVLPFGGLSTGFIPAFHSNESLCPEQLLQSEGMLAQPFITSAPKPYPTKVSTWDINEAMKEAAPAPAPAEAPHDTQGAAPEPDDIEEV